MFAYCGNNPVNMCDPSGHGWLETITDFFEKLYAAAEEAHKAAEERKKRFLEAYENTYGVTFESMVSYSDYSYSVSIETHYADKTASSISISAGAMGAIFSEIPVPGSSFVGGAQALLV